MKVLLLAVAWLTGALGAWGGEALSLTRQGAFAHGPVAVRWKADYPVALPGWSASELAALWARLDGLCFAAGGAPATPEGLLARVAAKVATPEGEGLTARALEAIAEVRLPFASKDWVGVVYDGYDNEGGNGCHARGELLLLAREGLRPMPLGWFVTDEAGLRRAVVRRLAKALEKEGHTPFAGEFSEEEAWKAAPDFLPTPEGVRFRYDAYTILPGCYGLPEVTVPWSALVPFCDADRLTELKSLLPKPQTLPQENAR